MIRTSGKPAVSALARSSFESSCIAAHSAPWPTSDVVTPSRAPSPAPRFSRRSTARSVAASSSTATRSGTTHRPAGGGPPVGLGAGGGGERDARDGLDAVADPRDRGAELRRRRAGLRHQHRGELRARHAREAGQRFVDRGRRRAGDPEAAAREVLGLAGGERERGEQDHRPADQDEPPAAAEEAVEAEHRGLHGGGLSLGEEETGWLASQGTAILRRCLRRRTSTAALREGPRRGATTPTGAAHEPARSALWSLYDSNADRPARDPRAVGVVVATPAGSARQQPASPPPPSARSRAPARRASTAPARRPARTASPRPPRARRRA